MISKELFIRIGIIDLREKMQKTEDFCDWNTEHNVNYNNNNISNMGTKKARILKLKG